MVPDASGNDVRRVRMPRAIDTAGLNDESVALDDLAGRLASLANCGRAPAGV